MEYSTLEVENVDGVLTIRLNRPETKNALTRQSYQDLTAIFRESHRDAAVRCIVLTGNGTAFCSGDDVKQAMVRRSPESDRPAPMVEARTRPTPAAMAMLECGKPIVAAVNGAAVGWGMDLALLCDIRIASERASFGELFVRRGLVADVGGLWALPRIVGPSKAAELLLTGDVISADEARTCGIVSRVVPHDELLDTAAQLAARIAGNAPLAVLHMKEGLRNTYDWSVDEMGSYVTSSLKFLFGTRDHREGVLSFIERRPAVFEGR